MMYDLIVLEVGAKDVEFFVSRLSIELEKSMRTGVKNIARAYAEISIRMAMNAGIKDWSGDSFGSLKSQVQNPFTAGRNRWEVSIPGALASLDQTPTRWVSLKKGREITRWVKDKATKFKGARAIKVTRKPWMDDADKIMIYKTNTILNKKLDKAFIKLRRLT